MQTRRPNGVWSLLLVGLLTVAVASDAAAQFRPTVRPARVPGLKAGPTTGAAADEEEPGSPVRKRTTRPTKPTPPQPGERILPGRTAKPPAAPAAPAPAGVIKRGGGDLPPGFDPASLGRKGAAAEKEPGAGESAETESPTSDIDDMIEFKSNYERGIKCRKVPLSTPISIDFEDAPLQDVVRFIGCITAKNFIMSSALGKGKTITIMSPSPVTAYEAYKAFLVALEMNGLTIVPSGRFLKIIEVAKARQDTIPMLGPNAGVPNDESLVTRMISLEHVDANEIQTVLNQFKTAAGAITVYAPTNTIFITDIGTNVRRLLALVKELDVPGGRERIWVRQIEYADATEIVDKLMAVFGPQGGSTARRPAPTRPTRRPTRKGRTPTPAPTTTVGEPSGQVEVSKILADERTNQLIIVANRTSYFKLDKLIRKLDVPIPGEGAIHILTLENADAEELSQTLSNLVSGAGATGGARRPTRAGAKSPAAAARGGSGAAALFEGEVKITAHKPTNALVVQASLKDFLALKQVIALLDAPRKQVYVEAIIMEVTSGKDQNFGISGSGGTTFDVGGETIPLLLGSGGLGISGFDIQQLNKGGLAAGLQGPLLDVAAGSGTGSESLSGQLSLPSFGFLIQAIQSNSDVNILSTPHILTSDNEEAEIQVGKQIPYMAQSLGGLGSLGALGGLGGLGGLGSASRLSGSSGLGMSSLGMLGGLGGFGSVQRIDVDLTLKITPHINESNFVRLETDLQIDDVESIDRTLGPTTSKRRVTNVVVVRDQQPVVIGGLIRDTESKAVDKVPFLGDIPLLGVLFRKTVTKLEKKNLLMVLIPHIITDPGVDLKRIHEQRMEEMRRFAEYMATRQKEYLGEIDYEKKHGVLEEMRQTIVRVRAEREARERSLFEESETDTVGPPETHDIEYDPYEDATPWDGGGAPLDDEAPVRPGSAAAPPEEIVPAAEPLL